MENHHIDELLKKYFEAETSVEEEKKLKEYFGSGSISERHCRYIPLFNFLEKEEEKLSEDFDERLLIAMQPVTSPKARLYHMYAPLLKIAAVLILVTSVFFFGYQTWEKNRAQNLQANTAIKKGATIIEINDTYDDPEVARAQLEKALALLGDKLNKGQEITVNGVERLEVMEKVIGN